MTPETQGRTLTCGGQQCGTTWHIMLKYIEKNNHVRKKHYLCTDPTIRVMT